MRVLILVILPVDKMACSKHVDSLCDCPAAKKVLKYRYTMSELREMLKKLGARKEAYVTWVARVEAILDSTESAKTGKDSFNVSVKSDTFVIFGVIRKNCSVTGTVLRAVDIAIIECLQLNIRKFWIFREHMQKFISHAKFFDFTIT